MQENVKKKYIMSVEEGSGVCKDRVKWRAICRGGEKMKRVS
jgi:hypothetical protein